MSGLKRPTKAAGNVCSRTIFIQEKLLDLFLSGDISDSGYCEFLLFFKGEYF